MNSPTLMFSHVSQILELIWVALCDSAALIRETGADVLRVCLTLMYERESDSQRQWFKRISDEAEHGISLSTNADLLHGYLLALREMFRHTGRFMDSKFNSTSASIIKLRDHPNILVRKLVMEMFSVLADFDPDTFVSIHLSTCVEWLVSEIKMQGRGSGFDDNKSSAYLALGKLCQIVHLRICSHLPSIFDAIRHDLSRIQRNSSSANAIFQCLSMLSSIRTPVVENEVARVLDLLFAVGLSQQLKVTLCDLVENIPTLASVIREQFLNMLSNILCGISFQHPGAPRLKVKGQSKKQQAEKISGDTVLLALTCLGSFNFQGMMLQELIQMCASTYLQDVRSDIRRAAAITCCQLLARDPVNSQTSKLSLAIAHDMLEKLLMAGVTDSDAMIRQIVFTSLDSRFDCNLAQSNNINTLFLALNDEVFSVREVVMKIIGRLLPLNPGMIKPQLRMILISLMKELQHSTASVQTEECAKLLCDLVVSCNSVVTPYVKPIMAILMKKVHDNNPAVSSKAIAAVGELSRVSCEAMLPFVQEVMPIVMGALQDQSSMLKRECALRTLGQICRGTGVVISPYYEYSTLLDILMGILKTEQSSSIRTEAIKVLGIIGAVDPFLLSVANTPEERDDSDPSPPSSSDESYNPTVVLYALGRMLDDQSLNGYHTAVVQAVMHMFESLRMEFVPHLPMIMPNLLNMLKRCPLSMLEFHLMKLTDMISIVGAHICVYSSDIMNAAQEFWTLSSHLHSVIMSLIETLSIAIQHKIKNFLPTVIPLVLSIFQLSPKGNSQLIRKAVNAFLAFGSSLDEYINLAVPPILSVFEDENAPVDLRIHSMKVLGEIMRTTANFQQSSKIIHSILRVLNNPSGFEFSNVCTSVMTVLAWRLGSNFTTFIPYVSQTLSKLRILDPIYESVISCIIKGEQIPVQWLKAEEIFSKAVRDEQVELKVRINQRQLQRAWDVSEKATAEDWAEWMRRFNVELLKESPSQSLRSCASLAAVYTPLARELFNAGFLNCWLELYDEYKSDLIRSLEVAISATNISPDILQTLLNLAEFMDHDLKPLPLDIRMLCQYSGRCHAWAKALHYKEIEYLSDPKPGNVGSLITINNQLDEFDAAIGILVSSEQSQQKELVATWHEKLNRWEDALAGYELMQEEDPNSVAALFGRMRCLQNLGEWECLSKLSQERFYSTKDEVIRRNIAPVAASAAWSLGEWNFMRDCIDLIKPDSPDGSFFRAVLSLRSKNFMEALQFIQKARQLLDTELTALISESYNCAYPVVVRVQMLAELEEIAGYFQMDDFPERRKLIRETWMKRLKGCQKSVDIWQKILRVHSLALSGAEESAMQIKFANMCRKNGKMGLSFKTLSKLLNTAPNDFGILDVLNRLQNISANPPQVVYACLKHAWASLVPELQGFAFDQLRDFTVSLIDRMGIESLDSLESLSDNSNSVEQQQNLKLLARCYLKLGEWQWFLEGGMNESIVPEILRSHFAATRCDKTWYKAWHRWALANFEAIKFFERSADVLHPELLSSYVVPAIQGILYRVAHLTTFKKDFSILWHWQKEVQFKMLFEF
ncbi:phosphatidylinositol kinase- protein kinase tor1 [Entophlyctis sp. JEL0112]|nr:phosphatidylinositol kinase- protein kinase tor1 [Entophlyctis sp. JEL0112]